MEEQKLSDKERKLKYVKIYDLLYSQIRDGRYPKGSRLPSEPELAKQMGVSRMTLRQALALLQEDELIQNIQGKGNFILDKEEEHTTGLETIAHPIYLCCSQAIEKTEMEFRLEPPSEFITHSLEHKSPAVVIADRWYKNKERVLAYTLTFLPIETISLMDIDLNSPEQLEEFIEKKIYLLAAKSLIKASYSSSGNFTAHKYQLDDSQHFIMLLETLYDSSNHVLAANKHYIPAAICHMDIHACNRA